MFTRNVDGLEFEEEIDECLTEDAFYEEFKGGIADYVSEDKSREFELKSFVDNYSRGFANFNDEDRY